MIKYDSEEKFLEDNEKYLLKAKAADEMGNVEVEGINRGDDEEVVAGTSKGFPAIQKKITKVNFTDLNNLSRIKYIVIHYVGATGTAFNNVVYFYAMDRGASAHYFVDENSIWQCVEDADAAWHCGGVKIYKHPSCRNSNSIGIEICCKMKDGKWYFEPQAVENAAYLTKMLMDKYKVPAANVLRHYDVTGKNCPEPFVPTSAWLNFKSKLTSKGDELDMTTAKELQSQIDTLSKHLQQMKEENPLYKTLKDVPSLFQPAIKELMDKKIIAGDTEGNINLYHSDVRLLIMLSRTGVFK